MLHFYEIPLCFALVGLVLYTVLGGADFGAGMWQMLAGPGELGERIRDHAHDSMAPVWEANHVWLVFVLVVVWTAYPVAFGSIASTLCIPLFIAGIGIVLRGATYALRSGTTTGREVRTIDTMFAVASLLTPFALGAVVGGIASLRVPVGNAAGNLVTSWLNPTGILIGVVAVATSAYLSAVYLAADAVRLGDASLETAFRIRALAAGVLAGAVALAGLAVLHSDAPRLYHGLLHGGGLVALIVSVFAGVATLGLVWGRRYEPARYTAALAVAAIVAGWALAQRPLLLRDLTIKQAAAPHDVLVLVVVVVLAGAAILLPSLVLLFRLVLGGRLGYGGEAAGSASADAAPDAGAGAGAGASASAGRAGATPDVRALLAASASGLAARAAVAGLLVGIGMLTIAEAGWAHIIGVIGLFCFMVFGFAAVAPATLAAAEPE
jgi:cytochrome d ubiquinol oxidase subunit II